jgi:hypothetical protein
MVPLPLHPRAANMAGPVRSGEGAAPPRTRIS